MYFDTIMGAGKAAIKVFLILFVLPITLLILYAILELFIPHTSMKEFQIQNYTLEVSETEQHWSDGVTTYWTFKENSSNKIVAQYKFIDETSFKYFTSHDSLYIFCSSYNWNCTINNSSNLKIKIIDNYDCPDRFKPIEVKFTGNN